METTRTQHVIDPATGNKKKFSIKSIRDKFKKSKTGALKGAKPGPVTKVKELNKQDGNA